MIVLRDPAANRLLQSLIRHVLVVRNQYLWITPSSFERVEPLFTLFRDSLPPGSIERMTNLHEIRLVNGSRLIFSLTGPFLPNDYLYFSDPGWSLQDLASSLPLTSDVKEDFCSQKLTDHIAFVAPPLQESVSDVLEPPTHAPATPSHDNVIRDPLYIYLSGPMRDIDQFNYPRFHAVADTLRDKGYIVFNPAESFGGDTTRDWRTYMRRDIDALLDGVDAVAVLPGWQNSVGATLEVMIAFALGLDVIDAEMLANYDEYICLHCLNPVAEGGRLDVIRAYEAGYAYAWTPDSPIPYPVPTKTLEPPYACGAIAHEAVDIVYGDRTESYGPPTEDFTRTGKMWATLLGLEDITAEQVALMMVLLKVNRESYKPGIDNRRDGIGYLLCLDEIVRDRQNADDA